MIRAYRLIITVLVGLTTFLLFFPVVHAQTELVPLYRYWNPNTVDHYYSTVRSTPSGYTYEFVACYVAATQIPGTTPLYHWWNSNTTDNYYTANPNETPSGYIKLGIEGYVAMTQLRGTTPLYQWWWTNEIDNDDHFYTTNPSGELAPTSNYTLEGIACYVWPIKLFVLIPGINDNGLTMLTRAANMVREDSCCTVPVREEMGLSEDQVSQLVMDATINAQSEGKDVVVLIDMDLENYWWQYSLPPFMKNPWGPAVKWAGEMANIVSEAFLMAIPIGWRMLYAHSAGGDATYESIRLSKEMMYDDINILNGRTKADKLGRALTGHGYGWQQVKVFTAKGDYPAEWPLPIPELPFHLEKLLEFLWKGSISNYDAAREWAGEAWVHLHSETEMGHNGLRDSIGWAWEITFDVMGAVMCDNYVVGPVEEMMLWDWEAGCPPQ